MTRVRARGEDVRNFILQEIEKHPSDITRVVMSRFGITRQAVNKHLKRLVSEGAMIEEGITRNRSYKLAPLQQWHKEYIIEPTLAEDVVWTRDVRPVLGQLPDNVLNIWQYAFTEMFNNAIDHSGGTRIGVVIRKTAVKTEIQIGDDGVGIFRKIQAALNLLDERHAVLELAKGKLTTDPRKHSGEGIFFTSRAVDKFDILSGGVFFTHDRGSEDDWALERDGSWSGTSVFLELHNHRARTLKKVFDSFSSGDDYGFTKTVVPVDLARYGNDQLISRSQARRVLARVELFKTVVFDFKGVESVGQAFADEIFRVFALDHSNIKLLAINANSQVKRMIERARSGVPPEEPPAD